MLPTKDQHTTHRIGPLLRLDGWTFRRVGAGLSVIGHPSGLDAAVVRSFKAHLIRAGAGTLPCPATSPCVWQFGRVRFELVWKDARGGGLQAHMMVWRATHYPARRMAIGAYREPACDGWHSTDVLPVSPVRV